MRCRRSHALAENPSIEALPAEEVALALGTDVVRSEPAAGRGYGINTSRWRVELADSGTAFVKVALDELAAGWLRKEHNVYASVRAPFLPRLLGWRDSGVTLLAIEDLSDAYWPPPWTEDGVRAVLDTLAQVRVTRPPAGVGRLEDLRDDLDGWSRVAAEPAAFLRLGLCSEEWLASALPTLSATAAACELAGDEFLHLDVRSDNLCLSAGRALLVDWNWATVGNALLDVVAWLPSLRLEGGPEPWQVVDDSRGFAALMAGFFAWHAGQPPPATAPRVRRIQRQQGAVALAWAARELRLPDLDSAP